MARWTCLDVPSHCDICEGCAADPWLNLQSNVKLHAQMEQWILGPTGALPEWTSQVTQWAPFLFERRCRQQCLRLTAFGVSHALNAAQADLVESKYGRLKRDADRQVMLAQSSGNEVQLAEAHNAKARVEERFQADKEVWVGRMKIEHAKLVRSSESLLPLADALMAKTCKSEALLEVGFEGETGFGAAVTQSFFSQCALELARRSEEFPMWVDGPASVDEYLFSKRGLGIQPLAASDPRLAAVCQRFRFLGRLMAKALREGFLVPLALSRDVFQVLQGECLSRRSLPKPGDQWNGEVVGALAQFAEDVAAGCDGDALAQDPKWAKTYLKAPYEMSFYEAVSTGGLSFLAEGNAGLELVPGGEGRALALENLAEFLDLAEAFWLLDGISAQVQALRSGIDDVFPVHSLRSFTSDDLQKIICGERNVEWTKEQLKSQFEWTRGLHPDRTPASWLIDVLVEMGPNERSVFLDFVTSCPSLPPGGLKSLSIVVTLLTDGTSSSLPRSRACANTVYLPKYESKTQLQEKLATALQNFHGMHET
jgi:hypothetical protein